ncbi:histidine triad nucleotide-binding protein [Anaeromyxobacter oryzae]|uniref:Histidine triad nucleotide-binding protein n=1 Tax=Anaeromyxobacter oryzae TaxID=2918170 RepID=A0ABN6MS04_9BACT|nr:histidine triad nucleotide-binding protein [Anaeromyxobacter oryzae]BDG03726.1 histidine triad nucleotide-binding protein [Anaeromyxobacter oryzae]
MSDCLFCKIVKGEIPAKKVHEDADTVAFQDINPQAPTHLLVVPRKHIPTMNDIGEADEALVGKLFRVGARLAEERGIAAPGWRAVMNANRLAGQTVFHLHLHVLGGRAMTWPPG